MLHRRMLCALIVSLSSALVGCGEGVDRDNILIIAVQGDARSLDPHEVTDAASMRMIENLYSTLLRYGEDHQQMELVNDLASEISFSDDGLTCTITLVSNAVFHSGRPVTSADVKYSIERIIDKGVRQRHFTTIEAIQTPDEHTVILKLTRPTAALLTYLAHPMNAIVDRQLVEDNDGQLRHVSAGSGPFKLAQWRRGQHLKLERYERYHVAGLPKLDGIIYRPIADETAARTAIRIGEVDILHEVPGRHRETLETAANISMVAVDGTFWEYIGLNCQHPPLDDVRVRQAIAWAVDREQLNERIKHGYAAVLTGGHIPAGHWAYAGLEIYPRHDPARARELLAEADYADGFDMQMIVDANIREQRHAAELVKQHLAEVGIEVDVQSMEPGIFYQQLNDRNFQSTLVGWMGFVDPDEWVADIYHSQGAYNQQQYANADLDQLIELAAQMDDRAERAALYQQIQRTIAEEVPTVFLYINPQVTALRDRVRDYHVHPTATTIYLRQTTLEPLTQRDDPETGHQVNGERQ